MRGIVGRGLGSADVLLKLRDLLLQSIELSLHGLEVGAAGERYDRNGRRQLHDD
jgi:hypothetical protein